MNVKECFREGLLRKVPPSPEIADKEMEGAKKYLDDARKCLHEGMAEMAVVAVYTSMFHAARALLFRDGIRERSHVCVIAYLGEKYPSLRQNVQIMDVYRRERHNMLYGVDISALEEDARQGISAAETMITAVKAGMQKPIP